MHGFKLYVGEKAEKYVFARVGGRYGTGRVQPEVAAEFPQDAAAEAVRGEGDGAEHLQGQGLKMLAKFYVVYICRLRDFKTTPWSIWYRLYRIDFETLFKASESGNNLVRVDVDKRKKELRDEIDAQMNIIRQSSAALSGKTIN